ncbi:MAG: hypothetical protein J5732_02440 [Bacteroidaceae bacterium]|nr:hypothetical protein [Bacteroidaceae bacterium]
MRKFFIYLLLIVPLVVSSADFKNDFYRVQNIGSGRYIYVTDNTGKLDVQSMSIEAGAVQLWKGFNRAVSDPASVIYIKEYKKDKKYDLISQGIGIHDMIGYYVLVYYDEDEDYWEVYAEGRYLYDSDESNRDRGYLDIKRGNLNYRHWNLLPIDSDNNYFGLTPNVVSGDKYYKPFYADFAFSFLGTGMKAWYVNRLEKDAVVISEVPGDIVPDRTPVFVECSSGQPVDNKLALYKSSGTELEDNLLKGVFFQNNERYIKSKDARTAYDPETMRVLGVMNDGRLGYITSDIKYLNANESYLTVPKGYPSQIPVMTQEEYSEYTSVRPVPVDNASGTVWTINGIRLGSDVDWESLPSGIYILNGLKVRK